jgi:hypothetical protein
MAKPTQITVGVTYKKALPNYENITFHAGITMALAEDDNQKKVYKQAWDIAGDEISKQLALFEEQDRSGMTKGL